MALPKKKIVYMLYNPCAIFMVISIHYRAHRMNENVLKITSRFAVQGIKLLK